MAIEILPAPTTTPQQRIVGMRCRNCGATQPIGLAYVCPACFGPLEVAYDYAVAGATLTREAIAARAPGIWRYAEVLPVDTADVAKNGRIKLNPLADWTWGDVWHYISVNGVDYNPLHDAFYPSIGCAPCTRAISLGEDFRAGRWWWEDESAKECGLHVKKEEKVAA